ncbi:MAG: pyridoxal 5'-phosphate synthase glutaminase subunit PdxT [Parachlamydiaceae bacterium]|nr:pyridoxal 5'-phosphate synthase glutaminase subunit PdxT [Parachlamydiaceae bacterium]
MTVGVLALQGAFAKHQETLKVLGVTSLQVRKPEDLLLCDGLIIPGGESTTIFRQMKYIELINPLMEFAKTKPIFGTCAGLILMSKKIRNFPLEPFGILDVIVERNAFGRQIASFSTEIDIPKLLNKSDAFFIRAPSIVQCGPDVQILATYEDEPVLVQQGHHLGATFHTELTSDTVLHEYFLSIITNVKNIK